MLNRELILRSESEREGEGVYGCEDLRGAWSLKGSGTLELGFRGGLRLKGFIRGLSLILTFELVFGSL